MKPFLPILILFLTLTAFFITGKNLLDGWKADQTVLLIGNTLLFVITLASYLLGQKGLRSTNPHAFVRSVYGSIMIKLFVCMIAAFIYISVYQKNVNKPALFTLMGLYLLYTFLEVSVLTKMLKEKRNG